MLAVNLLVNISDYSVRDLSLLCGIRERTLSDLLNGNGRRWSKYYLDKLSRALEVESSDLVTAVSRDSVVSLIHKNARSYARRRIENNKRQARK